MSDLESRLRSYVAPDDIGRQEIDEIRALMHEAADEIARLTRRIIDGPPRGACGMRWHHADCNCDGMGGDR